MRTSSLSAALAIMTGAGIILAGPSQAVAASTVQSRSFDFSTTNGGGISVGLAFAPFSALLGTLTEVDISLSSGSFTGSESFSLTGAEGGSASFSETAALLAPSGTTLTSASGTAATGCYSGSDPCTDTESLVVASPGLSSSVVALTGAATAPYLTAPSFTAQLKNYMPSTGDCGFVGDTCSVTDKVRFAGSVNVTYNYTPAAIVTTVPEPASMTLLGSGFLALVAARRRARRTG